MRLYRISLLVVVLLVASPLLAAEAAKEAAHAERGFTSIFNGKDLTGWDGDPRLWSVKDGVIHGETTKQNPARGNTFCVWRDGKLKNFVLKIKFRIENGNSGIQYRSQEIGKWRIGGYQAEIENKQGKVGFLYHERGRGYLVRVGQFVEIDEKGKKNAVGQVANVKELIKAGYYKEKDWNEYTIIARGNHIIQILNGYQTIELIDNDPKGRLMEGLLALQIHAGAPMVVEFKDIRVKQLPGNYGEAVRLFNGEDLTGWTLSSDKLKDTWSAKNGVLANTGRPGGYIRTTKDYTSYVLHLQLRHLKKGNSGVLLRVTGPDKVWPRSIEAQGMAGNLGDIFNIGNFPMKTAKGLPLVRHARKMHPSNEKPLGQWNRYELRLIGGDLELEVNGLVQNIATECEVIAGKIGIQSEGAAMEYRNIVLVPVSAK